MLCTHKTGLAPLPTHTLRSLEINLMTECVYTYTVCVWSYGLNWVWSSRDPPKGTVPSEYKCRYRRCWGSCDRVLLLTEEKKVHTFTINLHCWGIFLGLAVKCWCHCEAEDFPLSHYIMKFSFKHSDWANNLASVATVTYRHTYDTVINLLLNQNMQNSNQTKYDFIPDLMGQVFHKYMSSCAGFDMYDTVLKWKWGKWL